MSAPQASPPPDARRTQRRLPLLAKYVMAGAGAAALLGLAVYLVLQGRHHPALSTALCVVAVAVAVLAQLVGATRRTGGRPGA